MSAHQWKKTSLFRIRLSKTLLAKFHKMWFGCSCYIFSLAMNLCHMPSGHKSSMGSGGVSPMRLWMSDTSFPPFLGIYMLQFAHASISETAVTLEIVNKSIWWHYNFFFNLFYPSVWYLSYRMSMGILAFGRIMSISVQFVSIILKYIIFYIISYAWIINVIVNLSPASLRMDGVA